MPIQHTFHAVPAAHLQYMYRYLPIVETLKVFMNKMREKTMFTQLLSLRNGSHTYR